MSSEKQEPVAKATDAESNPSAHSPAEARAKGSLKDRVKAIFSTWYYAWEIFGLVASGLAIIGVCMILLAFNNKTAPKWTVTVWHTDREFDFTINSLMSIVSTTGSICAMIPVTKCLSQLKYLWFFEKDRTLADLDTFDSASRGKAGSAKLLWRLRFKLDCLASSSWA